MKFSPKKCTFFLETTPKIGADFGQNVKELLQKCDTNINDFWRGWKKCCKQDMNNEQLTINN